MHTAGKIGLLIAAVVLITLGLNLHNFGVDRYNPTDRTVTLIDVGVTIDSVKTNEFTHISGVFVDKETGLSFASPVDLISYAQFKEGHHKPLDMVRLVSLDTVHGNSFGQILMFVSFVSCFFGLVCICWIVEYFKDEHKQRRKKGQNPSFQKST